MTANLMIRVDVADIILAAAVLAHAQNRERHAHRLLEALGEALRRHRGRLRGEPARFPPLLSHCHQLVGENPEDVEQRGEPLRLADDQRDQRTQPKPHLLQVLGPDQRLDAVEGEGLQRRRAKPQRYRCAPDSTRKITTC